MPTKSTVWRLPAIPAAVLTWTMTAAFPCASAPYQSDNDKRLCSIQGSVTAAGTGDPLRKAFVRLRASGKTYPAVTNDAGAFAIKSVEPGSYILEAERQGFVESQYSDANGRPIRLRLTPGDKLTGIDFKLTPQAVISGRVVDDDGDVWFHAQVELSRVVWEHGRKRLQGFSGAEVDDQGQFRIPQLPPGKYYLAAEPDARWESNNRPATKAPALRLQPTWYPSSREVDGASAILLEPGQQVAGLEIRLQRGTVYRIRGSVSGSESIPEFPDRGQFFRRTISAELKSGVAANSYGGVSKPDGSFEIPGVPPGSYEILIRQGWPSIILGRAAVQVNDRDVDDLSIALIAPRPLQGKIRIEGDPSMKPSGLTVTLISLERRSWSQSTESHDDGNFTFALVGSERYRVRIQGALTAAFYLKELRYGETESSDGTISVAGAGDILAVTVSTRGARLVARISDAATTPSQVVLIPAPGHGDALAAVADQNGGFAFDNLAPGAYKLYAFQDVPDGLWEDPDFVKQIEDRGVDIQLKEGDAASKEAPLILKSDLAPILKKLGLE